ncbi:hypothetical protein PV327_011484 [Microctonus hyperodae]|uniref:Uncharacterized protein n=1 Tax=Microctonus hyperodae TaxID=165561 RepID=A0AA39C2W6_MICHY|nr:hypothetical protein PV327_011484 [Microctonus hyperodae]
MRDAISPEQRLLATLRYLASGATFEELKFQTAIAAQTLGKIIMETCEALIHLLKGLIKQVNMNGRLLPDSLREGGIFPTASEPSTGSTSASANRQEVARIILIIRIRLV